MNDINYPIPDRSNYKPHFHKNEDGDIDIGCSTGITSDGRPYKSEMWAEDCMSFVTIFMSAKNIEHYSEEQLIQYLESENMIRFYTDDKGLGAEKYIDPSGNLLWSMTVTIGVDDERYATTGFGIKPYKNGKF
jgi:hypothetical protein